ncbi:glycosyltransferase [Ruegeria lacuscaerulensis]|uniref:glycosyltransferase n=1 Tax=Ruegeria lacuscaerulensis TaxID=55218 RepID=UPI00148000B0|nr:glycosyltransferase [Ruegeria lacuscaerulensis]
MKIAIQCFNYAPNELGGSERSARDIARSLKARGHDVRVVVSDGSRPYPDHVDNIPIDVVQGLPIGKSPLHGARHFATRMAWILRSEIDPVLFLRSLQWLRRNCPDVVLMNNPAGHGSAFMLACLLTRTACVPVIRDYGWFCAFGTMEHGGAACNSALSPCFYTTGLRRLILRRQKHVVAISNHVARIYETKLGYAPTVIYNAVPDRFLQAPRAPAPDAGTPLTFGYLGRLHPSKGVAELITAWQNTDLAQNGHRLLLAGDNQGIALPDDPAAAGICLTGRQEAIAFLDRLDVLFLPALWAEPFGRTVIEAMARGLFVVGSPNGGIPELIPPHRGLIPEQIDAPTLSAIFNDLAQNPDRVRATRVQDPEPNLAPFRTTRMIGAYEDLLYRATGLPKETRDD